MISSNFIKNCIQGSKFLFTNRSLIASSKTTQLSHIFQYKLDLTPTQCLSNVLCHKSYFSTTSKLNNDNLMEFFDKEANWYAEKVKHGRAWSVDDLRLKSNTDIHKLWYVLHKERNMLLTMEEVYKSNSYPMPNPERIAKVDESMENILAVVQERNIAYNLLETGSTQLRLPYRRYNSFGFLQFYREREYLVPWYMNKMWKLKYHYKRLPLWSKHYRVMFRAYLRRERRKKMRRVNYAKRLILTKHPEFEENGELIKKHFEEKYEYKPPLKYSELIKRPSPDQLPKSLSERLYKKNNDSLDEI